MNGEHLIKIGVVDEIIPEPFGGAHRDPEQVATDLKKTILKHLKELSSLPKKELLESRYKKYRTIGEFTTG